MAATAPATTDDVIVKLDNISFRYFESEHGLTDVTLTVRKGERILLLGHNGSGKSTLLSIVGGKRRVCAGTATVLGSDAFEDTSLNHRVSLIGVPWPPEAYFNSTVRAVASPAPDEARRDAIARTLHLPMGRNIDKMSAGEKRRVQILCGLMRPPELLLLDECNTEVDVAERQNVMRQAQLECETRGAACLYATHILDGVEDWATRVVLIKGGRVIRDEPWTKQLAQDKLIAHSWLAQEPFTPFPVVPYPFPDQAQWTSAAGSASHCEDLSFRGVLDGCGFTILKGSRTLLTGCNGSGKSTLLHLMTGKVFFGNKKPEVTVLGKRCYHDMSLNYQVAFGGDWWAKPPEGEMHVGELVACPLTEYAENIRATLRVNLSWDVRHISAGEVKRVQLFLALLEPREVVLLDEATADLDLDMRHILLHLLYRQSVERGVTVVYTTHIFEGLDNWATDCIVLDRTKKGVHAHMRGSDVVLPKLVETLIELKRGEVWEA